MSNTVPRDPFLLGQLGAKALAVSSNDVELGANDLPPASHVAEKDLVAYHLAGPVRHLETSSVVVGLTCRKRIL